VTGDDSWIDFEGGPRREKKRVLERDVQATCVDWIRGRLPGIYARKFSSPARRSVPDYVFTYNGFTWYVEFKAPGELPTPAQLKEHEAIRAARGTVYVIDDVDKFKHTMNKLWD
jgi:hypothetical protein